MELTIFIVSLSGTYCLRPNRPKIQNCNSKKKGKKMVKRGT